MPQWIFVATFIDEEGNRREIELHWRMFPLLQIGQHYRDGSPIPGSFQFPVKQIDLTNSSHINLMTARSAISEGLYRLYTSENLSEYCWVWTAPDENPKSYVIPVLVIMQGLFAKTSEMTNGMTNPIFLDLFSCEATENRIDLKFPENFKLPRNLRERESYIKLLARIKNDTSFLASFKSVSFSMLGNLNKPLKIAIPDLDARLSIRAIENEKTVLALGISYVRPLNRLQKNLIAYHHPHFPQRDLPSQKPRTTRKRKAPKGYLIEGGDVPAGLPTRGNKLPAPDDPLVETQRFKVKNVGPHDEQKPQGEVRPSEGDHQNVTSFAGTGPQSGAPQAEVTPGGSQGSPPPLPQPLADWEQKKNDGLDHFRVLLSAFRDNYPPTTVHFYAGVKQMEEGQRSIQRPYAIAAVKHAGLPTVWLIEFAIRLNRPLSMLVIIGAAEAWSNFYPLLTSIVADGLDPQYWWITEELNLIADIHGIEINRFSHARLDSWADRLFRTYFA